MANLDFNDIIRRCLNSLIGRMYFYQELLANIFYANRSIWMWHTHELGFFFWIKLRIVLQLAESFVEFSLHFDHIWLINEFHKIIIAQWGIYGLSSTVCCLLFFFFVKRYTVMNNTLKIFSKYDKIIHFTRKIPNIHPCTKFVWQKWTTTSQYF